MLGLINQVDDVDTISIRLTSSANLQTIIYIRFCRAAAPAVLLACDATEYEDDDALARFSQSLFPACLDTFSFCL